MQHMHGLSQHVKELFALCGFTFDNVGERLMMLTKPARGVNFTSLDHRGPEFGGMTALTRFCWQIKAMFVLNVDTVPEAKSIAWLRSLQTITNDEFYAISVTMPGGWDHGAIFHAYQACWLALAFEKYSLYDGAIRFADLQLEPEISKAGTPLSKWPQVIALACKGRVFAQRKQHVEALAAFQTAIAVSKESYSLMEALAYRELANYADGGEAAVQAGRDLELKLAMFKGQLTKADFDSLKITP